MIVVEDRLGDYRIGDGGPFRRFESICHLTNLRRQVVAIFALAWLPIAVLGLLSESATGRAEPLLQDPAFHVRVLVAMPVFLILDRVFPVVCGNALAQLARQAFIPRAASARFDRIVRSAVRAADSPVPELVLALGFVGFGVLVFRGVLPAAVIDYGRGPTEAQTYYTLVVLPLFEFLLWRSFFRWGLWLRALYGVSRIELDLVPTHPDRRGGIAFLRLPSIAYCAMLLFAFACVLCAQHGARLTMDATLLTFVPFLIAFAVASMLLAVGPLLLFVPQLARANTRGHAEIGGLSAGSSGARGSRRPAAPSPRRADPSRASPRSRRRTGNRRSASASSCSTARTSASSCSRRCCRSCP